MIPEMAANLAMDLQQTFRAQLNQAMAAFRQEMPTMLMTIQARTEQAQKDESKFFTEFPQLTEHRDTVMRLGKAYREYYPDADADTFIREVGAQAMVALKIPYNTQTGQVIEEEIVTETQTPHIPPRQSATQPLDPKPSNEFAALADEFLHEDADY